MRKVLLKIVAILASAISVLAIAPSLEAPMILGWVSTGKPIKSWIATASWYGPGFEGQPTASGQPFDSDAPTAAHTWLPFGTLIRVINPRTGQSQIARINDRGPFEEGRELDVSHMVASQIGIIEPGVADVRIEILEQPSRRPTP